MKKGDDRLHQKLAAQAQNALERHGLLSLPVDLDALAERLGIVVAPMSPSVTGISGMLARVGNTFGIQYATYTGNVGFERFSLAHELGHFLVEGHVDHFTSEGQVLHKSHAGFVSDEAYEREADHFAAGLLMPSKLLKAELRGQREGLPSIERLRKRAKASFTAAAIRYARVTDDPVAVVCSVGGTVRFCFPSDGLKELRGALWLPPGSRIPADTATDHVGRMGAVARRGHRRESECCLSDWFEDVRPIELREEVVGLGFEDRVMTVLSALDVDEDPDEEGEWEPRFR